MTQEVMLSIIIPTYKRPEGLRRLLQSIGLQKSSLSQIEIIVVNNSMESKSICEEIINRFLERELPIRLFHQPLKGSSHARNLGIEKALGKWLAFFDDDEEVDKRYLESLLLFLSDESGLSILGGPRFPVFESTVPEWVKVDYFTIYYGSEPRTLSEREYLPGGNFILNKSFVDKIGMFSPDFGHKENQRGYGEDTEFISRATNLGGVQHYFPNLCIYHYIPPERVTLNWFINQKYLSASAKANLYLLSNPMLKERHRELRTRCYTLVAIAMSLLRLVMTIFKAPFRNRHDLKFYENYWVEKISPLYVRYRINVEVFSLLNQI